MTSVQPAWLTPQAYARLRQELATLRELFDGNEFGDDADGSAIAVQRASGSPSRSSTQCPTASTWPA